MKVLVIDDERLARNELRRMLAAIPEVELVGEAANADEAIDAIERLEPELLLLDVQMPECDGFQLLERLDSAPAVIFTTAFDAYALRAFEVSALDYLVKPIAPERLVQAVAKAKVRRADTESRLGAGRKIFVRDGQRCWFVALEDVVVMESEGNYTKLVFAGESPMLPRSLAALEDRLDPQLFFRANRRQIINLRHIQSIATAFDGGLRATLTGDLVVELSRRQARKFAAATRL
ncbi:MAG: LytTR family DNA-binding domain-containing protein [Kofleriaceae bacterium]